MNSRFYVDKSPIHGDGLYTSKEIKEGESLGWAINSKLEVTAAGKMVNHSITPTIRLQKRGAGWAMIALRDIKPDEEITADYNKDSRRAPIRKAENGWSKIAMALPLQEEEKPEGTKTGLASIYHALDNMDLEKLEQEQWEIIRAKRKALRPRAVAILNAVEGLKKNNVHPRELMIQKVPVIPPAFRPFAITGDTFLPGDANELYRDLMKINKTHQQTVATFGEDGANETTLALYDTVKALYGYGEPVEPKTKQRGVSGFLSKITGSNPKFGWVSRKMLSKPQDSVGRSTITVAPDLKLNEIGVPEAMAWKMYAPYIQRRLVQRGFKPAEAVIHVRDKTDSARKALDLEIKERPTIASRAPAWHKFNVLAFKPVLHDGQSIRLNNLVTAGYNADFDGDTMNLHVPSSKEAVKEAYEKLMPDKMLFSIKKQDEVVPVPKHESVLGLYTATRRPSKNIYRFNTQTEANKAIEDGKVSLSDDVEITNLTYKTI